MTLCAQNESCYATKKGKISEAESNDFIICHVPGCGREFHTKCIGFTKAKKEKFKFSFLCTRCDNFMATLRSIISEEVERTLRPIKGLYDSLVQPAESEPAIETNNKAAEVGPREETNSNATEGGPEDETNSETTEGGPGDKRNNEKNNANGSDTGGLAEAVTDESGKVTGHDESENQGQCVTSIQTDSNAVVEKDKLNSDKVFINSSTKFDDSKQSNKFSFLCHIEKELTLNDVKLILQDNNIRISNISFSEADCNFKSRKFVRLEGSPRDKFHFKTDLQNSGLKHCWFLKINRLFIILKFWFKMKLNCKKR